MNVTTKKMRRCNVLVVTGRVDSSTVKILAEAIDAVMKETGNYNLVVNLNQVTFISSAGLSLLIDTQNRCKQIVHAGELVLAEVPERIQEVLSLAGLTPLFKQYPSEVEAVGNF